jgi:hypothetical protein
MQFDKYAWMSLPEGRNMFIGPLLGTRGGGGSPAVCPAESKFWKAAASLRRSRRHSRDAAALAWRTLHFITQGVGSRIQASGLRT